MLGIEDYGSDGESGDDSVTTTSKTPTTPTLATSTSLLSKLPPPTSKSTLALPPPKSSSSSLSLPEPSSSSSTTSTAPHKLKRTKKIAINLPSLPPPEDDGDDGPPTKKPRVAPSTGAGMSSLLSMLPAPKQPVPVIEKKEERVLGGGGGPGLVFRTKRETQSRGEAVEFASADRSCADAEFEGPADVPAAEPSTSFVPPSLKRGKANISLEEQGPSKVPLSASAPSHPPKSAAPAIDIFSLGLHTPSARSIHSTPRPSTSTSAAPTTLSSAPSSSSFTISSAPAITTFRPPSPTLDDSYPGYYQLPSGAYAPYDPTYYASYAKKWKAEYDKHIRALEKAQYEPDADDAESVDMAAEMERARREVKEREDRKALTTGGAGKGENGEPAMPRMNVKGAKLGAVARSRHQLTTLLTEAYSNREVLEERIAQGRRNRKEAGMKYGECLCSHIDEARLFICNLGF